MPNRYLILPAETRIECGERLLDNARVQIHAALGNPAIFDNILTDLDEAELAFEGLVVDARPILNAYRCFVNFLALDSNTDLTNPSFESKDALLDHIADQLTVEEKNQPATDFTTDVLLDVVANLDEIHDTGIFYHSMYTNLILSGFDKTYKNLDNRSIGDPSKEELLLIAHEYRDLFHEYVKDDGAGNLPDISNQPHLKMRLLTMYDDLSHFLVGFDIEDMALQDYIQIYTRYYDVIRLLLNILNIEILGTIKQNFANNLENECCAIINSDDHSRIDTAYQLLENEKDELLAFMTQDALIKLRLKLLVSMLYLSYEKLKDGIDILDPAAETFNADIGILKARIDLFSQESREIIELQQQSTNDDPAHFIHSYIIHIDRCSTLLFFSNKLDSENGSYLEALLNVTNELEAELYALNTNVEMKENNKTKTSLLIKYQLAFQYGMAARMAISLNEAENYVTQALQYIWQYRDSLSNNDIDVIDPANDYNFDEKDDELLELKNKILCAYPILDLKALLADRNIAEESDDFSELIAIDQGLIRLLPTMNAQQKLKAGAPALEDVYIHLANAAEKAGRIDRAISAYEAVITAGCTTESVYTKLIQLIENDLRKYPNTFQSAYYREALSQYRAQLNAMNQSNNGAFQGPLSSHSSDDEAIVNNVPLEASLSDVEPTLNVAASESVAQAVDNPAIEETIASPHSNGDIDSGHANNSAANFSANGLTLFNPASSATQQSDDDADVDVAAGMLASAKAKAVSSKKRPPEASSHHYNTRAKRAK